MIDLNFISKLIKDLAPVFDIASIPHVEYQTDPYGNVMLHRPEWYKAKLTTGEYIKVYNRSFFTTAQWFQYTPRVLRKNGLKYIETRNVGDRNILDGRDLREREAWRIVTLPDDYEEMTKLTDDELEEFLVLCETATDLYHGLYNNFFEKLLSNQWSEVLPEIKYHDDTYVVTEWLTGDNLGIQQVLPPTTQTVERMTGLETPDFDARMHPDLLEKINRLMGDELFPLSQVQENLIKLNKIAGFTFNVRPLSDDPEKNAVWAFRSWPCTQYEIANCNHFNQHDVHQWKINNLRKLSISHVSSC